MNKIVLLVAMLSAVSGAPVISYSAAPAGLHYSAAPAGLHYSAAPAGLHYSAAPAALHYSAAPAIHYSAAPAIHYAAAPAVKYAAAAPAVVVKSEPAHSYPAYSYGYSVADAVTGDNKQHSETRDGDRVSGQYSFLDADNTIRTVTYTADDVNGFNAVVDKSAPAVVAAAPVQAAIASPVPVAYSAHPAQFAFGTKTFF